MKRALVSDIHGNLEALRAVQDDLERHDVEAVICLGDSVGYGPNPAECLDWARRQSLCVLGNAEESALFAPEAGGDAATDAMAWTRSELHRGPDAAARRLFLERLPRVARDGTVMFLHASPRSPLHEYLLPQDVDPPTQFGNLLRLVESLTFVGHTHLPGVFTEDCEFLPAQARAEYRRDGRRAIVNVGSVGQPRDGDRRACYVLWEDDRLEFRRVAYDIEATVAKMKSVPELANSKALRWLLTDGAT